jgi:hypothetical protein
MSRRRPWLVGAVALAEVTARVLPGHCGREGGVMTGEGFAVGVVGSCWRRSGSDTNFVSVDTNFMSVDLFFTNVNLNLTLNFAAIPS